MPIQLAGDLLAHARRHGYAVGYFESWDLASLEGVIDAAEQTRSPVVVGFNGEFLSNPARSMPARLEWYGALAKAAAETARVPCAAMFNECAVDASVAYATKVGFNLVMLADESAGYQDLTRRVAELTRLAHLRNVAVEAELGVLPSGTGEHAKSKSSLTDPDQAAAFVRQTEVDLLAVSTGNVHVLLSGQRELDLTHLETIRRKVEIPLVLHGGSGIAPSSLAGAIALGVAKVNYGTYLKQHSIVAIRQALTVPNLDPHHILGGGGDADLTVVVRRTVRDAVLERIGYLGCCGKA